MIKYKRSLDTETFSVEVQLVINDWVRWFDLAEYDSGVLAGRTLENLCKKYSRLSFRIVKRTSTVMIGTFIPENKKS